MKYISASGVIAKARRYVSGAANLYEDDVKDPRKLTDILRSVIRRLSEVESKIPPEALEFEVQVGASGTTTSILHNLGSHIRWYVTSWSQVGGTAYPVQGPALVQDATSDANTLVLRSYVAGTAIVRIEQANGGIDPGVTVAASQDKYVQILTADFTTTSVTQVSTGLQFSVKSGEKWLIQFYGTAGDSNVAGMKFALGGPAASTCFATHKSSLGNITTRSYQVLTAVDTLGNAVHTVAGGQRDDEIYASITAASDGTVSIGVASVAGTATVYAGSYIIATRVV